jgi:hypothetical protein
MWRVLDERDLVICEVHHVERDAEGGGGLAGGVWREERRRERDALHLGTGVAQDTDGELRV